MPGTRPRIGCAHGCRWSTGSTHKSLDTISSVSASTDAAIAPELAWTGSGGEQRALSDYRGKVVLVNFWATWCPPCRREIPALLSTRERFGAEGFEVIGVSVGERPAPGVSLQEHVARFAAAERISYPLLLGDESVAAAFGGVRALPTSVLIGRDGRVLEVIEGARDEATFSRMVEGALQR